MSAIAAAVSAGSGPTEPVLQVDAGGQRRDRAADRRQLLRIGQGGVHHGPYDTGHEWLGPPGAPGHHGMAAPTISAIPAIRVLDLRWRPDGSAPATSTPRATSRARCCVDWRRELVEDGADGETIVLAGPERVAEFAARSGIADGTTVVVYDDTAETVRLARLVEPAAPTASTRSGSLDGGYPDWVAEGRAVSNARVPAGVDRVHVARPEPRRGSRRRMSAACSGRPT